MRYAESFSISAGAASPVVPIPYNGVGITAAPVSGGTMRVFYVKRRWANGDLGPNIAGLWR